MTTEEATKAVRDAARAGLLAFVISLLLTAVYVTGTGLAHLAPLNWVELIALPVLSFGIARQSRAAAVLMFAYYLGSKIWLWYDERVLIGVPLALLFSYFFWRGMRGTFVLHAAATADEAATVHA